jgi:hypothetical protein
MNPFVTAGDQGDGSFGKHPRQQPTPLEKPMSRKIILALTAVAALGITALAPTSASAFGHFGGHGASRASSGHSSSFARSSSVNRSAHRGSSMRAINRGPRTAHNTHHYNQHPHPHNCHHKHCGPHHVWRHHHRPYWVAPVVGATVVGTAPVAAAYTAPVAKDNCNCLTKTYLEDGSVMFKDICTKEAAVATPDELKAQASGAPPVAQTK